MLTRRRRLAAVPLAVLIALTSTACSGGEKKPAEAKSATDVLADAAETLETTSGVELELTTPGLPDGVQGLSGADGIVTDAPAFDGELTVVLAGTTFDVPVISVDGKVYAQIPMTIGWQDIDPAEYNAPDPGALIAGEHGFASLLPATESPKEGESVRGGEDNKEVLTSFTGTVPGTAMKAVIPSTSGDSFDAAYQISDKGELRKASFTGVFYPDSEEMTYTVTFDDYGTTEDIKAP